MNIDPHTSQETYLQDARTARRRSYLHSFFAYGEGLLGVGFLVQSHVISQIPGGIEINDSPSRLAIAAVGAAVLGLSTKQHRAHHDAYTRAGDLEALAHAADMPMHTDVVDLAQ